MKFKAVLAGALLVLAATATPAMASWLLLGAREVTDRMETDTLTLGGHRQYESIRLCVARNPVHFRDVDVYYRNGGHQDISVASRINPGNCTRDLDLNGDDRDIDRIVVRYEETSRRRARATVRFFGEV